MPPSPPCVVFALDREAMAFWKVFPPRRRIRAAPCRAWLAGTSQREALVLETGLGRSAMETGVRWVLGEPEIEAATYRPPFLLLAGFSGGLLPGKPVGHLVLATEVVDEQGGRWPADWPGKREGLPEQGRVLTASTLVADPHKKRELGARYEAVAVDMESAAAARICHKHGVPFGCLRAISDDDGTPLSADLVGLLRAGRPSPFAVLAAVARRPGVVRELRTLAANTCTAAARLAAAINKLLTPEPSAGEI